MTFSFMIYSMRVSLSMLLALLVLLLLFFTIRLMTPVNLRCMIFWIPIMSLFITRLLSSFLYIGKVILYLKVPGSFSLI